MTIFEHKATAYIVQTIWWRAAEVASLEITFFPRLENYYRKSEQKR